jgi:GTPase SAR1 and related small G proteins
MKFIYFVGTAGSGKSTMVQAYKEWLDHNGIDSIIVNLDPGADVLPYNADIDIREWIDLADVMEEYALGPNGAQIVAADLMAVHIKNLTEALSTFKTEYVLVDTPGQLELFAFRSSSQVLTEALGKGRSMVMFLMDPLLCRSSNGFISAMMLSSLVRFRLQLPMITILSKIDVLKEDELKKITEWFDDPDTLYGDLLDNDADPQTVVGTELFRALENIGIFGEMRTVSSVDSIGMEDMYGTSRQIFQAGEDVDRS